MMKTMEQQLNEKWQQRELRQRASHASDLTALREELAAITAAAAAHDDEHAS